MFGLFSAKCPLDTWEKTWTETRMGWLAEKFGIDRLLRAEVVLPSDEYFPEEYAGTAKDARRIMTRLCEYMDIDPAGIKLRICQDEQLPGAVGHYVKGERAIIRVAESQLGNPMSLTATLAHELAHQLLLGGDLITADMYDHEWVTDLLPVFLGVGIFAANSTVRFASGSEGNWSWWQMNRQHYLPSRMFGYGMALFAHARGEADPSWVKYLRPDAASALRGGLRFLRAGKDCLFQPNSPPKSTSEAELAGRLRTGTPSARLAALWEARWQAVTDPDVVAAVTRCLRDGAPAIPAAAAQALAVVGPAAAVAVSDLLDAAQGGTDPTRAAAAEALGILGFEPERVVPEIALLLQDGRRDVVFAASAALHRFGAPAAPATPRLLTALSAALVECDHPLIECLVGALRVADPKPELRILEHFADEDGEFCRHALDVLREQYR
jgi:hypothetical protein